MLICDIRSAQSLLEKKEEKEAALRAERDSILQGLQMTGSMAALGMTGSLATMSKSTCCYLLLPEVLMCQHA